MSIVTKEGRRVEPTKAALFIDFDNIYLSLQKSDRRAAENFARQPDRWVRWLAAGAHEPRADDQDGAKSAPRSVLLRRCYLTPSRFGDYRPFFARAGFSVVDCPPLTRMGKNSADIVMVMDVLDALEHATRFEEFIVFSGDADFTPVLLRLRTYDRRTAVLTDALTAAAYRAATDIAIPQELFIENALGIDERPAGLFTGHSAPQISLAAQLSEVDLTSVADSVVAALFEKGRLISSDLVPIFGRWSAFASGPRWFGHGTLRRLCERLAELRPEIEIEPGDELAMRLAFLRRLRQRRQHPRRSGAGPRSRNTGRRRSPGDATRSHTGRGQDGVGRLARTGGNGRSRHPYHPKHRHDCQGEQLGRRGHAEQPYPPRRAPDMSVHLAGAAIGFVYDPTRHSLASLPTASDEPAPWTCRSRCWRSSTR